MTHPHQQVKELAKDYGTAVEAARSHMRRDKWTVFLYLADFIRIAFASASYAAMSVPLLWFWVTVYDLESVQKVFSQPIDRVATWNSAMTFFGLFFVLHLTLAIATGHAGASARRRAAELADRLFVVLRIRTALNQAEPMDKTPTSSPDLPEQPK